MFIRMIQNVREFIFIYSTYLYFCDIYNLSIKIPIDITSNIELEFNDQDV